MFWHGVNCVNLASEDAACVKIKLTWISSIKTHKYLKDQWSFWKLEHPLKFKIKAYTHSPIMSHQHNKIVGLT